MDNSDKKVFDEFPTVDCNECSRYWDNSCDSVDINSKGSTRLCNSYLPTRNVVIPQQIKSLQNNVKRLTVSMLLTNMGLIILAITLMFKLR